MSDGKKKKPIPKRIAGVKLNKELRRRGNALLALADTPEGRETIAVGLSMAAAAASVAIRKRPDPAPRPATEAVTEEPAAAPNRPPFDADAAVAAALQAVDTALARFFPRRT